MHHLVTEIRSALNYQTDTLKEELQSLRVGIKLGKINKSKLSFLFHLRSHFLMRASLTQSTYGGWQLPQQILLAFWWQSVRNFVNVL